MTIIIASVSNKGYVTSSDGRTLYNDDISSEDNDKTFALYGEKIRGAYAGMMSFGRFTSGGTRKVGDYIEEISKQISPASLEEFAKFLSGKLLDLIKKINNNEWSLEKRKLVVFLTGGKDLQEKDFMIIEINFTPNRGQTDMISGIELQRPDKKEFLRRSNSASHPASNSALTYLDRFKFCPELTVKQMQLLHGEALKIAFNEAEKHKKGSDSPCGGSLFFQPSRL